MILDSLKSQAKVFIAIDFPWLNRHLTDTKKMRIATNGNTFSVAVQLALQSDIDENGAVSIKKRSINPQIDGHVFYDDVPNYNSVFFTEAMSKFERIGLSVFPIRKEFQTSEHDHRTFFSEQFRKHTLMAINCHKYQIIVIVSDDKGFQKLIEQSKKSIYFFADESMKGIPNSQWRDVTKVNWYKPFIERGRNNHQNDFNRSTFRAS